MTHISTSTSPWDPEFIGDVIGPGAKELLEIYSGIPSADVNVHVARIAKQGWDIVQYPCFRLASFLNLELSQLPVYPRIVDRVKQGALFIDLGCGLGQDIRRLAYDGAPSENMVGLDLREGVIELGYELFKDKNTLKATFLAQNFFEDTPVLREMIGKFEIVNSGLFMHLWDWAGQVRIGQRMIELLTPQGGLITGLHSGGREAGDHKAEGWVERCIHNEMSFRQMWIEIERLTGAHCKLEISAQEGKRYRLDDQPALRLQWVVEARK
ncbi:hypothetical protein AFCA_001996 [Aspergillus flavus]|uniref:Methyltransferase domain-containing protein n=1 Tax=Aspergillus flavus TaxID=5059 RepID=A0AB74BW71_ASPFL|nr:hypothetical protein CA14_004840 [Aspergillus flavus]UCK59173.1 hypothetical protein AFCA_001996 [Aspergillus flavus]